MSYPKGYSAYTHQQRLDDLQMRLGLSDESIDILLAGCDASQRQAAEHWIENALSCFPMPYGIVPSVMIDGVERVIPMVIEESSVIAALSKMAKHIEYNGQITTTIDWQGRYGHLYIPVLSDQDHSRIKDKAKIWIDDLNSGIIQGLKRRGGGAIALHIKRLEGQAASLMLQVDCCDAMGANSITMACEQLKRWLYNQLRIKSMGAIVSNHQDHALTHATMTLNDVDPQLANSVVDLSHWAQIDVHRAVTHNKGICNGIDGVLLATASDWRAVNAMLHAYAAHDGQYRGLTTWRYDGTCLTGRFQGPIGVGTVGGVTASHPMAQLSLSLLSVSSSPEFSRVLAAVGLMQNAAALMALAGQGLVQGHMRLHISNWIATMKLPPGIAHKLSQDAQASVKQGALLTKQQITTMAKALIDQYHD